MAYICMIIVYMVYHVLSRAPLGVPGNGPAASGAPAPGPGSYRALKKTANYSAAGGFELGCGTAGRSTEYIRF